MDIGIRYSSIYAADEQYSFNIIKQLGIDCCDFPVNSEFYTNGAGEKERRAYYEAAKKAAEAAGVYICQVKADFSSNPDDYESFDEIVKRVELSIEAAAFLGAKYCVIPPYICSGSVYGKLKNESLQKTNELFEKITPALEKYDVYACVRNMFGTDPVYSHTCPTVCSHAKDLLELCNSLGERFMACLDTGHCELTDDCPHEAVHILKDKLATLNCHHTDSRHDLHAIPFTPQKAHNKRIIQTRTDWTLLMQDLDDINYKGVLFFDVKIPGPKELNKAGALWLSKVARYIANHRQEGK